MSYDVLFEGMVKLEGDDYYSRVWIEQHSWNTEVIGKPFKSDIPDVGRWEFMIHNSIRNVVVTDNTVSFEVLNDPDNQGTVTWSYRPYIM
jgi:hypothetical protein